MLLCYSWKVGYVKPLLGVCACVCVCTTVGRIRTCSKAFNVRLPPRSVCAQQMCGYWARGASTCEAREASALLFMCLRLPGLCYFLLSLCSAALAPAPSSHSAALAGVLRLTLPRRAALCRHAAAATVLSVARRPSRTQNTHTHHYVVFSCTFTLH